MNKSMTTIVLGLLSSGTVWSQLPMDTDGDGAVSLSELQAVRPEVNQERFAGLDANGDGLLTTDEFRSVRDRAGRQGFDPGALDPNDDGAISLAELQAVRPEATEEQFARMDTNGDGVISGDERPQRGGGSRDRGGRGGRDGRGSEGRGTDDATI